MKILKTGGQACFEELPLSVNWSMTRRCNYRCSYCFHYGKGKNPPPQLPFSTLEQLKTAVDNIASLNRPWYNITFGGGEPTIHPHLFELISMLHEKLGERLNKIVIITNGSRNKELYIKLAELAKSIDIRMNVSLHTDHVELEHILELVENLSADIDMDFSLMFNPDKRDFVHEIYEKMFEARKKYWFKMNVITLRDGDRVDPRYTPEDFSWQKKAVEQFDELIESVAQNFPPRRKARYFNPVIREVEDNGETKIINQGNRTLELASGGLSFTGMYCIAHAALLFIGQDGRFKGMVCGNDRSIGNIFKKNAFTKVRDKFIHLVKCTRRVCGCSANDSIPKFASRTAAKKYVEFAQKKQAKLFSENAARND